MILNTKNILTAGISLATSSIVLFCLVFLSLMTLWCSKLYEGFFLKYKTISLTLFVETIRV